MDVFRPRFGTDEDRAILKENTVVATPAEEYQPAFSPDGKEVAYLENRVTLKVANLATRQTRTIVTADKNYSYADGDQYYQWSPDGKWFLVQFGYPERVMTPQVGLVPADGKGEITNLTLSGYDNFTPKWAMDGALMIWGSDRDGTRQQGGDPYGFDVWAMFFSKGAFDKFRLTKEEFALLKEQEDKEKKEADEKAKAENIEKSFAMVKQMMPQQIANAQSAAGVKDVPTNVTSRQSGFARRSRSCSSRTRTSPTNSSAPRRTRC